jgi:uncharacterized protein YjiS (DUF1127 family)
MATNIPSPSALGKLTDMIFARATPKVAAELSLAGRIAAWRRQRQAEADLARLSDRELADIGLTRQSIAAAVRMPRPYR